MRRTYFCRIFLFIIVLLSASDADIETETFQPSHREASIKPALKSGARFDQGLKNGVERHVHFAPDVKEGSHRKSKEYRKKKARKKLSNPSEDLQWTHTSFINGVYQNEMSWSQSKNLLLSPVALEVSLGAFCSEVADSEILSPVASSLLRTKVVFPLPWFIAWLYPPEQRHRISRSHLRKRYLKILQSLTFVSVNLVSTIYTGENVNVAPFKVWQLKKYFKTQVHEVPRTFNIDGKPASLLPPGLANTYNPRLIILSSALHFKGKWKIDFDPQLTKEDYFNSETSTKLITFIGKTDKYFYVYHTEKSFKILELQFSEQTGPFSLLLFLPCGPQTLTDLENGLAQFDWLENPGLILSTVQVSIPRFSIRDVWDFKDMLREAANVGLADVDGINQNLAFSVNEWEATSYTSAKFIKTNKYMSYSYKGMTMEEKISTVSMTSGQVDSFIADHPFMFALVHRVKKIILLQGHVVLPEE